MRSVRSEIQDEGPGDEVAAGEGTPGKVTLTSRMQRGASADDIADKVVQRLGRGSGSPLDAGLRGRFETSLGADLGGVRVHTGGDAADAAGAASARAFAHGQDVYFGAGQYQPDTAEGQYLIAHEVAHTVQQQGAAPAPQFKLEVSGPGDACEEEADSVAAAMVSGTRAAPVTRMPVQRIARDTHTSTAPPVAADVILEQIAHRLAYQPRLSERDTTDLRGWGYEVATHQVGLRGSLDFLGVRPIMSRDGLTPVLAFRGTLEAPDFIDDANPEGIGMYQFSANEALIRTALEELGGNTTVTGHSLGGALAQICAAMYPAMVGRIVTFQSPGIRPDLIERMRSSREGRAIESHHYRVLGDFVEHAGGAYTPGDATIAASSALSEHEGSEPLLPLHQSFPLAERAEDAGALPDGVRFPESGERHSFDETTIETTTDEIVTDLEAPRAIAGGLVAGEEGRYTRVWMRIRREAEAGRTRWSILQARIDHAEVTDANKAALRENLAQLFPELAAAGALEPGVVAGTGHVSRGGFIDDVADRVGTLSDEQRTRVGTYYDVAIDAAMRVEEDIGGRMSATGGASAHHRPARRAAPGAGGLPTDAHAIAARGAADGGGALPYQDAIQAAFGHHDLAGVRAHQGGEAAAASEALGARAYAYGSDVVFAGAPDLHTAAHEAAHVVQQRGGVHLAGGVGEIGDAHERHADAVADLVVRGESAEAVLDEYAPAGGAPAVQRRHDGERRPRSATAIAVDDLRAGFRDLVAAAIATIGGEAGEEQSIELTVRIPADVVCVTGSIQMTVAHETGGYRIQARPELGLGLVTGGAGHADLLTGLTLEVSGHDPRTAADLLGLALEHEVRAMATQPPPAFICVALAAAAIEFPFLILGGVVADLAARGYNYATTGEASDPFWLWLAEWLFGEHHVAAVHDRMRAGDYAETIDGGRGIAGGEGGESSMEAGVDLSVGGGHHWRAEAGAEGVSEHEFDTADISLDVDIGPVHVGFEIHVPLGGDSPPPGQIQVTFGAQTEVSQVGVVIGAEVIAAGLQHLLALRERFGSTVPIRDLVIDASDAASALSSAARVAFEAAAVDAGEAAQIGAELQLVLPTRGGARTATVRMTSGFEADGAGDEAEYRHSRVLRSWTF